MGAWIEINMFTPKNAEPKPSHPTMGAWIEIKVGKAAIIGATSHPTMGAWIEIRFLANWSISTTVSHPTMGAWIEMDTDKKRVETLLSRTPRWVRGLKYMIKG